MSEYPRRADGTSDLPGLEAMVRGEEAGASEFVRSEIKAENGKNTNIVTFETLPPGQLPNDFLLRKATDVAPPNATKIWAGTMLVSNARTDVVAYRSLVAPST